MTRPDIVIIMTDQERATPPYEGDEVARWRSEALAARRWFGENGVTFDRHHVGSLACVPGRPTLFTGHYPDVHGVTQTDGLGKFFDDSRMRWLREGEVPTMGNWFRAGGYDTHYDGKWHMSHVDLIDPETGESLATNDDDGTIDSAAVDAYLDADPLAPYGFSGWVGPEPHGAAIANAGIRRDPLIADRVVAWLEDRYARRAAGDAAAQKPFLLVACFVNPHDIVFFPGWARRGAPLDEEAFDVPAIAESPTEHEDLRTKPAAQVAYRASYPTTYGPGPLVERAYRTQADRYRRLYYRLMAEVDEPIDRVRRAVTDQEDAQTVMVYTADHGELLGSHGGLHQKWFNLYDEACRVPFVVARVGEAATAATTVDDMATSHVDLLPTLLAAAGIDQAAVADELRQSFSEVHPLPGRDLMPVVADAAAADVDRAVYMQTRDNMPEGDSGASGLARMMGRAEKVPVPLRIQVPAHVGANLEAVVARVGETDGGANHLWKIVRTFDDPATWTEPNERHLSAMNPTGPMYRTEPIADEWELYDLIDDPIEAKNLAGSAAASSVFAAMKRRLDETRTVVVPERNEPWPYEKLKPSVAPRKTAPPPARALRKLLSKIGMHPDDADVATFHLAGRRALVVATNHGTLDIGKATGVFASEMTVPYYAFLDAGMEVDVASPLGGVVPVDPQSLKPVIRTDEDDRFLADDELRDKVMDSYAIGDLDMDDYDIVCLAGGWGAAFDFGFSQDLADKITEANVSDKIIGGVCHGPLGLRNAKAKDGRPLVEGRRVTGVSDKQVSELGIESTPHHPETELRRMGGLYESETKFRDPFANHWVVDGNLVTGQNQNAAPMVAREMMRILTRQLEAANQA